MCIVGYIDWYRWNGYYFKDLCLIGDYDANMKLGYQRCDVKQGIEESCFIDVSSDGRQLSLSDNLSPDSMTSDKLSDGDKLSIDRLSNDSWSLPITSPHLLMTSQPSVISSSVETPVFLPLTQSPHSVSLYFHLFMIYFISLLLHIMKWLFKTRKHDRRII